MVSGRVHKAAQMLGLVFFHASECHGEHDDECQTAPEFHLRFAPNEVMFETEADVEPAVDAFGGGSFFVFAMPGGA